MSDPTPVDRLPTGQLVRAFSSDRVVRILVIEARGAAEQVRRAHQLEPEAALLAAEAVVATALLSAYIKGEERVTLQIQGEEPRFSFIGEVDAEGALRARLTPSDIQQRTHIQGACLVIKSDVAHELYRGVTGIHNCSLEAALQEHFGSSSQIEVVLRIGSRLSDTGEVIFAGGLLVERLPEDPNHPSISTEAFEQRYAPLLTAELEDELFAFAFGKLKGDTVEILDSRELIFRCRCRQNKVEATLGSLGVEELYAMKAEGGASVTCNFCNTVWQVSVERLSELIALYTKHEA